MKNLRSLAVQLCDELGMGARPEQIGLRDPYLTIREFHTLLSHMGASMGRRQFYRWLGIQHGLLPPALRGLLAFSPATWYATVQHKQRGGFQGQPPYVIPLRYLSGTAQHIATTRHLAASLWDRLPERTQAALHVLREHPEAAVVDVCRLIHHRGVHIPARTVYHLKTIYFTKGALHGKRHDSCQSTQD